MNPNPSFWQHKRVLITGHSGFKGAWLTLWLHSMGAKVYGLSLPPDTNPNLFDLAEINQLCEQNWFVDIRNGQELAAAIDESKPEIVFHLAAQALVRASYRNPIDTFSTNIMGTVNVLEALRLCDDTKVAIMITTDKVYENKEWSWPYRENDSLGGHDPYSSSKAACELVINSYKQAFFIQKNLAIATARAGNVIGGGDWSKDRLIPDAIRAWQSNQVLNIRNPKSTRPWQHVLDPLSAYLNLAEKLWESPELAGAYNFGPNTHEAATVKAVIDLAIAEYPKAQVLYKSNKDTSLHEAGYLALEIAKARALLGFNPHWNLSQSVKHTISWYRKVNQGGNARALSLQDINSYLSGHG